MLRYKTETRTGYILPRKGAGLFPTTPESARGDVIGCTEQNRSSRSDGTNCKHLAVTTPVSDESIAAKKCPLANVADVYALVLAGLSMILENMQLSENLLAQVASVTFLSGGVGALVMCKWPGLAECHRTLITLVTLLSRVGAFVVRQRPGLAKRLRTQVALVRFLSAVGPLVVGQSDRLAEALSADVAHKWTFVRVGSTVAVERHGLGEGLVAQVTSVRAFPGVNSCVNRQVGLSGEPLPAHFADVQFARLFSGVDASVLVEVRGATEHLLAGLALERDVLVV